MKTSEDVVFQVYVKEIITVQTNYISSIFWKSIPLSIRPFRLVRSTNLRNKNVPLVLEYLCQLELSQTGKLDTGLVKSLTPFATVHNGLNVAPGGE